MGAVLLLLFSRPVAPDSLQPHGLQWARPPCPYLLKFAQILVHFISDAIQPSHPLTPFSSSALSLSHLWVTPGSGDFAGCI